MSSSKRLQSSNPSSTLAMPLKKKSRQPKTTFVPEPSISSDDELRYYEEMAGWNTGEIADEFKQDGLDYLLEVLPQFRGDKSLSDIDSEGEFPDQIDQDEFSDESDDQDTEQEDDSTDDSSNPNELSDEDQEDSDSATFPPPNPSSELPSSSSLNHLSSDEEDSHPQNSVLSKKIRGLVNRAGLSNIEQIIKSLVELLKEQSNSEINIEYFANELVAIVISALKDPSVASGTINILLILICEFGLNLKSPIVVATLVSKILKRFFDKILPYFEINSTESFLKIAHNFVKLFSSFFYINLITPDVITDIALYLVSKMIDFWTSADVAPCVLSYSDVCYFLLRRVGKELRTSHPHLLLKIVEKVHNLYAKFPSLDESSRPIELTVLLDLINSLKNGKTNSSSVNQIQSEMIVFDKISSKIKASGFPSILSTLSLSSLLQSKNFSQLFSGESSSKIGSTSTVQDLLSKVIDDQKINTAQRRAIFEAISVADSIDDAIDRLWIVAPLKNTDKYGTNSGKRYVAYVHDISRVVLNCVCAESKYNKFYEILTLKLSEFSKEFMFGLQLALWDRLKNLELKQNRIKNVAKFCVFLVGSNLLKTNFFKTIEFDNLSEKPALFWQLFITLLIVVLEKDQLSIFFSKLSTTSDVLVTPLVMFIQEFVLNRIDDISSYLSVESPSEEKILLMKRSLGF
ncbi:hypothetical protein RCL1_006133 [Eukaryota sp. TZLM3-RCL]